MDNQPIRDPRVLEAIEACRPGSADAFDPALAGLAAQLEAHPELEDLYGRLQKIDATLAGMFHEVPVPEGLGDRLLARLAAAQGTSSAAPLEAASPAAAQPAPAPQGRRRTARPWLLAAAGAAAAAVLLVAGLLHVRGTVHYTAPIVLEEAVDFFNSDLGGQGHLLSEVSPPRAFPSSPDVLRMPNVRWRTISGFLERSGVAYDMISPRGTRATLYVVKRTLPGLPAAPSARPVYATANCSTSVWQQNALLYVLVVQGGPAAYAEFLDLPRGPVT